MSAQTSTPRDAALAFLDSRIDYERRALPDGGAAHFKLDRIRELLERLGSPQNEMPIVHVTGTKGKGSTAAMIAAALSAAGYRTGLFSSPHLYRVEERLAVNGRAASADELIELVDLIRPHVEAMDCQAARQGGAIGPTYFEITTAMALVHFSRARVQGAVLEVGMGGRLDSTNVCQPLVSVITSISFDHTRQLGSTLAAIAREKGGIIKPGVPVVSGVTQPEPRAVIRGLAAELESRLLELQRDFTFEYDPPRGLEQAPLPGQMRFYPAVGDFTATSARSLAMGLIGRHQAANAAVALATLGELERQGWRLPETAVQQGLLTASCPARIEVLSRHPTIILDAAHNVASVRALIETLDESFSPGRRILVFATTLEKDVAGMVRLLLPRFAHVVLTRYTSNPRGVPVEDLAQSAAEIGGPTAWVCADPATAWDHVRALAQPSDLICLTGSFFLAADLRVEIDRRPLSFSPESRREIA